MNIVVNKRTVLFEDLEHGDEFTWPDDSGQSVMKKVKVRGFLGGTVRFGVQKADGEVTVGYKERAVVPVGSRDDEENTVFFDTLVHGEFFLFRGSLYINNSHFGFPYNAVNFSTGGIAKFVLDESVRRVTVNTVEVTPQ